MKRLGQQAYQRTRESAARMGREIRGGPIPALVNDGLIRVRQGFDKWMDSVNNRGAGRKAHVWKLLKGRHSDFLDICGLIAIRMSLDRIASGRTAMNSLAIAIGTAINDEARVSAVSVQKSYSVNAVQADLHSAAWLRKRKLLKMEDYIEDAEPRWSTGERAGVGALFLEIIIDVTSMLEVVMIQEGPNRTVRHIRPTVELLRYLEEGHEYHESLHPFWMPMVERPGEWTNIHGGGYNPDSLNTRPLVRTRNRAAVSDLEAADLSIVTNAVNSLQSVAWVVNQDIYEVARYYWFDLRGDACAALPSQIDPEEPKPDHEIGDLDARRDFARRMRAYHDDVSRSRSRRLQVTKTLWVAKHYLNVPSIYNAYYCDFRGRTYCWSTFMSPMGSDLDRALLLMRDGQKVTSEDGIRWFKIGGANLFGKDKAPFEERVQWVEEHRDEIYAVYRDPLDSTWWQTAKSPFCFLAWCLEYGAWLDSPEHKVRFPIHLDGSCNGLALYSMLLKDPVAGKATNVTPSETPQDIYMEVAAKTADLMLADDDPKQVEVYRSWLKYMGGSVPRDLVKRPVLIMPYSGTKHAATQYIRDWYRNVRDLKGPHESELISGRSPFRELSKIAGKVWDAIGHVVSSARKAMQYLREVATAFFMENKPVVWTAPNGWKVRQEVEKQREKVIHCLYFGKTRIRYREDTGVLNKRAQLNGICPQLIHSLDASVLHAIVNQCRSESIPITTIHDSFACLPEHVERMSQIIREEHVRLFSGNFLAQFHQEVMEQIEDKEAMPSVPVQGDLDLKELLNSPYCFC